MNAKTIAILFGLLLGVLRIVAGITTAPEPITRIDLLKDAAHLFMGGLAACWWFQRQRWQVVLFWSLNVVEVAVAVLSRM